MTTATAPAVKYFRDRRRGFEDVQLHHDAVAGILSDRLNLPDNDARNLAADLIRKDSLPENGITPHYARALDDIYELRRAAAYEARVLEAHYEGISSFPKTRYGVAVQSVDRLRMLARGEYAAVEFTPSVRRGIRDGFKALGLDGTLTNDEYEQEQPLLVEDPAVRASRFRALLAEHGDAADEVATEIATLPYSGRSGAYSEAVTEIYSLRGIFAFEAENLRQHLEMKTFPKSRRGFAEEQRNRFIAAAQGEPLAEESVSQERELKRLGASTTLSRAEFEAGVENGLWGWMATD
ncbi:hypothetical protein [Curtobacterium sp. MCBD17_040]|uniref:hypothetical protein n=1 Tax=Curtobacterium sp. MCBD17_040 TaxID=2175674 RepID=UPI000DA87089|nr:hypothetical protein [Curtobacterium sp. MCBD17_040]WIB65522.1 hypothetical protein DEI94_19300 [Curtobacterium sp. MCBD17_040]